MHNSPNLRSNIIVSNNNSVIFCSGFFSGPVLVNLERKEITKKQLISTFLQCPKLKKLHIKKQRGRAFTLT